MFAPSSRSDQSCAAQTLTPGPAEAFRTRGGLRRTTQEGHNSIGYRSQKGQKLHHQARRKHSSRSRCEGGEGGGFAASPEGLPRGRVDVPESDAENQLQLGCLCRRDSGPAGLKQPRLDARGRCVELLRGVCVGVHRRGYVPVVDGLSCAPISRISSAAEARGKGLKRQKSLSGRVLFRVQIKRKKERGSRRRRISWGDQIGGGGGEFMERRGGIRESLNPRTLKTLNREEWKGGGAGEHL